MGRPTLTDKQSLFVREYLVNLNGADAVRKAGYKTTRPDQQAYELLRKPEIKEAIQSAMDARAERIEITQDYVLRNIVEIGERCMQRAPVMVGHGKDRKQAREFATDPETGEERLADVWEFDSQGALRAQELLGKHLKLFTDKTEISGPDGGPVTLNILPVKAPTNDSQIKNTPEIGNSSGKTPINR